MWFKIRCEGVELWWWVITDAAFPGSLRSCCEAYENLFDSCFAAFRTNPRLPGWRFYPLRWALITIPTSLRISRKDVCSWLQCWSREIGFFFDTNLLLLLLPPVSSILCTDVLFFRWSLLSQSRVPSQDTLATSTRDRELRCSARPSARRL